MSRARVDCTYRVHQLPANLHRDAVAGFLATASHELGPPTNIRVFSVAPSLRLYEQIPTKVATLTFRETPSCFDNDDGEWKIISKDPQWPQTLLFDVHFIGFTPLNDLGLTESRLDCIAISGLASHAFGSWKQRGNSNFMWLRDRLPLDMPFARSIIYGYDTRLLNSESFQGIDDLAMSFFSHFRAISAPNTAPRSLVFFAHSLGGVVLKQAIAAAANSGEDENAVLSNIRMIFFFGVPNQGMYTSHLLVMTGSQPNEQLIRELSRDSDYLARLDIQFSGLAVFREMRFISVYETKRSRTTKEVRPGVWKRDGPYEMLVTRSSAIQRGTRPLDIIPIDEDHSDIVKFSEQDPDYYAIHSLLRGVGTARSKILDSVTETPRIAGHYQERSEDYIVDPKYLKYMLESLCIEETTSRRDQIEPTYSQTFAWIFEESELQFTEWLRKGKGIYWIRGKPGSGKSTLMKFLYSDPRTWECLDGQAEGTLVSTGWFFFYGRGSRIQKSFEGLLYSILHQILSAQVLLAKAVLPLFMEHQKILQQHWPLSYLKRAFNLILQQNDAPLRLYLFLDALDEYEGQPETVVNFLKSLVSLPSQTMTWVNICFSSRPWNAFVEEFDVCPGFSIHERTRRDIWEFTEGKMMDHKGMNRLLRSSRESEKIAVEGLVSTIAEKARGVFLWVRLVVEEVLRARTDGASINELVQIISEMPVELKDYYEIIIQNLPVRHRLESYVMFEILLRSTHSPVIFDFAGAIDCALCETLQDSITQLRHGTLSNTTFGILSRRLQSRSGGLVEITGEGRNALVSFMHQTVKELIGEPGFEQRMLGKQAKPLTQNGHTFLFKYYLAVLHSSSEQERKSSLEASAVHGSSSELTTGMSQTYFLDSIEDRTVYQWCLRNGPCRLDSVMSLAVWNDLRLYVMARSSLANQHTKLSLLHVAVQRYIYLKSHQKLGVSGKIPSSVSMCRLLLSRGIERSTRVGGKTPFEALFELLWREWQRREDRRILDDELEIVAAFLDHGQDPNVNLFDIIDTTVFRSCKALHVSHLQMTRLLLHSGAEVNALTSGGHTPLDLSIQSTITHVAPRDPSEGIATTMLLLDHGGCITEFGEACLKVFLSALERHSEAEDLAAVRELSERFRRPPRLLGPLARRGATTPHLSTLPISVDNMFKNRTVTHMRSLATRAQRQAYDDGLTELKGFEVDRNSSTESVI